MEPQDSDGVGSEGETERLPNDPINMYFTKHNNDHKCVVIDCRKPILQGDHTKANRKRHLRRHHPPLHKDYLKEEAAFIEKRNSIRVAKKSLKSKRKSSEAMPSAAIKKNLVRLVALRGRPLKMMDDPEFQALTKPLVNQLKPEEKFTVNSENVRTFIEIEAENIRESITKELKGKMVSLKIDSCSRGARPFFAVNAQFIENKALQIRTLKVKEMFTEQSAVNVKSEIFLSMHDYQVPSSNIYTVTCDNGANMVLATHLITEAQEEEQEQANEENLDEVFDNCKHNVQAWDEGCCATVSNTCQCIRCAAHTLQLAIEHAIKSCQETKNVLTKVRTAVNTLRTPTSRRQLHKEKLPVPTLDNSTRWNTKYSMLVSLQNLKKFVQKDYVGPTIDVDWDDVASLIAALEPAKEATVKLQKEQLLLGDFVFIWMSCKEKLAKEGSPLAAAILKEMDKMSAEVTYRSGPRMGTENWPSLLDHPAILAAIYMDPRIFTHLDEGQVEIAKKHLAGLWLKLEAMHARAESGEDGQDDEERHEQDAMDQDSDDEDSAFLRSLQEKDRQRSQTEPSRVTIMSKLTQYYVETKMLKKNCDVLEFWDERKKTHPELFALSCVALAVPATQVSVERLFSSLKFMLDPLRMALKSQIVDDLLVIRNNTLFMEKEKKPSRKKQMERPQSRSSTSSISLSSSE